MSADEKREIPQFSLLDQAKDNGVENILRKLYKIDHVESLKNWIILLQYLRKIFNLWTLLRKKLSWLAVMIKLRYHFTKTLRYLKKGLKSEKQLQNENHTEDWALGSHPRDNGHVTH